MGAVSRYRSRHIRTRMERHVMSIETVAGPVQDPSHDRTAEGHRSPLRDFLGGAALIFDFAGTLTWRHVSTVRHATDADALAADWDAVGDDLRWAMGRHPSSRPAQ